MKSFRDALKAGTPLLIDGATGTELYNRGIFINRCFEDANLANPALIKELHQEYLDAGAQILTTNSWGANFYKLAGHNLQDRVAEINTKAAKLAREVAGTDALVAGSVGPLGVRIEPWGPTSFAEAMGAFRTQIAGLVEGGADLISFETFADISELHQAILAARSVRADLPIIAHVVINPDGLSPMGTPIEWAMQKLEEWQVDVVGLNCSVGPQPMMSVLPRIRAVTKRPISLQPNAGLPRLVEGRTIYMCSPEYMAEFTKNFLQEGVQFVGGCCGTSPAHIKAMANAFRFRTAMLGGQLGGEKEHTEFDGHNESSIRVRPVQDEVAPVPALSKSDWARKIARGEMVYSVELLPPSGVRPEKIVTQSATLKKAGIDAINIPDGPRASARMSAILTAVMIEQRSGIETVLHYTCRDRNLLGMQSDMLGAHAVGLRNLLLVTGDPPKMGSYPNATGVFDVDAIGLTNMVSRLNRGVDLGGRAIGEPTAISIGVGVNPAAKDLDYEMKRFMYKVEAGAEWAITQPVFDVATIMRFLDHINRNNIRIPIIAGVWPLMSYRNAQFMNNEVPGIVIPPNIMERMSAPTNPDEAKLVGIAIAQEMIRDLGTNIQGVQISAPFGRIDLALAVIGRSMPVETT